MDCLVENNVTNLSPKKLVQNSHDSSDEDDNMCIIRRKVSKSQKAISSSDEHQESDLDEKPIKTDKIKNKKYTVKSSQNCDINIKNIEESEDMGNSNEYLDFGDNNIDKKVCSIFVILNIISIQFCLFCFKIVLASI